MVSVTVVVVIMTIFEDAKMSRERVVQNYVMAQQGRAD